MPTYHYDEKGNLIGTSLSDRERDEEIIAKSMDGALESRRRNQAGDQATFEFGCATIMAVAGFGVVFWHIAHGATVQSMLGGILFVTVMAGPIFYSAYKNSQEAKRH